MRIKLLAMSTLASLASLYPSISAPKFGIEPSGTEKTAEELAAAAELVKEQKKNAFVDGAKKAAGYTVAVIGTGLGLFAGAGLIGFAFNYYGEKGKQAANKVGTGSDNAGSMTTTEAGRRGGQARQST